MICRWLLLILAITVLSLGLLRAEEKTYDFDPFQPSAADSSNSDKMYEDIEVFRRILDRKLQPLYQRINYPSIGKINWNDLYPQGYLNTYYYRTGVPNGQFKLLGAPNQTLWFHAAGSPYVLADNKLWTDLAAPVDNPFGVREVVRQTLEGVYLKGQGVVYTATLSSLQPPGKAEKTQPVSEWESVRRQLRNEKEEARKAETSKPPSLSDVLLNVLAENGHHFSHLGENESLTIVLTVHDTNPPSPARKSAGKGSEGSVKTESQAPKVVDNTDLQGKVSDRELLGDLHQKQGHYEEAIKAFGEAAAREPGPGPNEARRLYRKLAQCYLALGEDEKVRKVLDHLSSLRNGSAEAKDKSAPTSKPAARLPVKLILSAQKKLLDEAKGGKIPFEDFRRGARVEMIGKANEPR
jgi:hypothetical protein